MSTSSGTGDQEGPFAIERRHLLERVAMLEAETKWIGIQALQIETLRRLGTWDVDVATGVLTWSEGTYRIFGLSPSDAITVDRALSFYPVEARATIASALDAALRDRTAYDVTAPFVDAVGRKGWVRTIGQMQTIGGQQRIVGVIEDVTVEKEDQDRLKYLVYRDVLTGLPNRRAFEARLRELEACTDRRTGAALFLVDVDHFKSVNDRFGHPAGDLLLREVGARLQQCAGSSDMVARLGGDEFAILLCDFDDSDRLGEVASRLLLAIRDEMRIDGGTLHPTASIGASHLQPCDAECAFFENADVALYRAKAAGRDRAEIFRSDLRRQKERDVKVLKAVAHAVESDQLEVFYQPIVDLVTSQVRGMEALVRWNHPERGILVPSAFSAALEDPRLSIAIDDFVMQRALIQMREWLDDGLPIAAVNVNASEAQLRRPELVQRVRQLLAQNRLPPGRLKVELVETAFLGRDPRRIAETIEGLAELGVACVLDDFGTGHASLSHLRQFRIERIKIDRSFVANICTDPFDRGLTRSIVDLGRNLGIRVTAEGVETNEQLALLRSFGCDCAQGYLIGKPMSSRDVRNFMRRWNVEEGVCPTRPEGAFA